MPQYVIPRNKEVPDYEGRDDPMVFSNWLVSIEEYFDCYDWTGDQNARFAKMKLVGLAQLWWYRENIRLELPPINTWQEMKAKLQGKYMPSNNPVGSLEQLVSSRHGYTLFEEYIQRLKALDTRNQVLEDTCQRLARFKHGLRRIIKQEVTRQSRYSMEHAQEIAPKLKPIGENQNLVQLRLQVKKNSQNLHKMQDNQIMKVDMSPIKTACIILEAQEVEVRN